MRPPVVGFVPPAPPTASGVVRAGSASPVVHSVEYLVLNDTPFAGVAEFGVRYFHLTHYDGTFFYCVFDVGNFPGGPAGYSVDLTDYVPAATAEAAANYLHGKFAALRALVVAETQPASAWPWTSSVAQVTVGGVQRWAVRLERGYPAGDPDESFRATPIVGLPQYGGDDGAHSLINWAALTFSPGMRSKDMVAARFGKANYAALPVANANNGGNVPIDPYTFPIG